MSIRNTKSEIRKTICTVSAMEAISNLRWEGFMLNRRVFSHGVEERVVQFKKPVLTVQSLPKSYGVNWLSGRIYFLLYFPPVSCSLQRQCFQSVVDWARYLIMVCECVYVCACVYVSSNMLSGSTSTSTTCSASLPAQHLRPSGLFSCRAHSLELSPGFYLGPDHQWRLFQASA